MQQKGDPFAAYQQPAQDTDPFAAFQAPAASAPVPGNAFKSGDFMGTMRANYQDALRPSDASDGGIASRVAHDYGRGAVQTLVSPFLHPLDTAKGFANAVAHGSPNDPQNPVAQMLTGTVQDFRDNGAAKAIPNMLGQATGAAIGGELTGPVIGGAVKAAGGGLEAAGFIPRAAAATGDSLKVAGTRMLTPGQSASDLFTRAAKPNAAYGDFADDVATVAPKLATAPKFGGLQGVADALSKAKAESNNWYQQLIDPHRNLPVNARPIAQAQMDSIPITDKIEQPARFVPGTPGRTKLFQVPAGDGGTMTMGAPVGGTPDSLEGGIVQRTAQKANNYNRDMPLGVVDSVRADTNAKLQSIWNKSGGDRYAALSDPENARQFATNNASRDVTYNALSDATGTPLPEIQANQNLYGAANKLDDVFSKRGIVFARQNPLSLQESLAAGKIANPIHAAVNWAGQNVLKSLTDSDALANAGMDALRSPDALTGGLTPRPGILPMIGNQVGNAMQGAGQAVRRFSPFAAPATSAGLFYAPRKR